MPSAEFLASITPRLDALNNRNASMFDWEDEFVPSLHTWKNDILGWWDYRWRRSLEFARNRMLDEGGPA